MQRLEPLQNGQFGSKIKNAKNMRKPILQEHYSCSVQKIVRKNTKYSRNETILKIGHLAKALAYVKAIGLAIWSVSAKNKKCQKHAKTNSTRTLEFFCGKNPSKKHQIFEKRDNFENRPSCKGYSSCQGYTLCKMVS